MRLLLVGAFAYPHTQGSQVYFQEQAIALRAAGAEIELLTYGDATPTPDSADPERWRALDGFSHTAIPRWAAPTTRRSGPNRAKLLADLSLISRLRRLVAAGADYDAILCHNAEAALAALHGLPRQHPPIVYCAHTLLEQELPTYGVPSLTRARSAGASRFSRSALALLGSSLDRSIARRADAWIALTRTAERVLRSASSAPGHRIAPPLPDPMTRAGRDGEEPLVRQLGLEPSRFFLYSGNLDPYQDLEVLAQVAELRRTRPTGPSGCGEPPLSIVVATHDERVAPGSLSEPSQTRRPPALAGAGASAALRIVRVRLGQEMRALFAAARATIVPRRALGGFPIKLVNSLAAGTPVVAYHGPEWELIDGHDSLICDPDRPVESLLHALERLEAEPGLARQLGAGARASYCERHRPEAVAEETLDLIGSLVERGRRRGSMGAVINVGRGIRKG